MPNQVPDALALHKLIEANRDSLGESQEQILERMSKELWKRTPQSKASPPAGVSSVGSIQSKTSPPAGVSSVGSIPNEIKLNRQIFSRDSIERVKLKIEEEAGISVIRRRIGKTRKYFDTSDDRVFGIATARPNNVREGFYFLGMRKLETIDAIFLYIEKSPDEAFTFVLAGNILKEILDKVSKSTSSQPEYKFNVYEESPTAWYLGFSGQEKYYLTGSKAEVDTLENYGLLK